MGYPLWDWRGLCFNPHLASDLSVGFGAAFAPSFVGFLAGLWLLAEGVDGGLEVRQK